MSRRRVTRPPVRPDIPEDELKDPKDRFKAIGNPQFVEYVEALEIWRSGTIALLPQIRKEQKEARSRGDQAEVDRLQKEYEEILDILAKAQ